MVVETGCADSSTAGWFCEESAVDCVVRCPNAGTVSTHRTAVQKTCFVLARTILDGFTAIIGMRAGYIRVTNIRTR